MAKVRIGFSTQFELENELVGIGTDNPTNTLQALGNIHSSNAKAVGVSTLTTFDGFVDTKASISGLEGSEQGSISGEIIIEGSATVSTGATFRSGPENLTVTDSFTLPGISDDKPSVGTTRFNENSASLEFYTGVEWRAVNSYVDSGNRGRGLNNFKLIIEYLEIATLGNAVDFGDRSNHAGGGGRSGASSTRGIFYGGSTPTIVNNIEYVTIASAGNSIDFGDMTRTAKECMDGMCSSTRLLMAGGKGPSYTNIIDYVEMHTLGNAIDFGDMTTAGGYGGATNSPVRGIYGGGEAPGTTEVIEYLTIASKGNSTDFGDLIFKTRGIAGGGNAVRGIFAGGELSPAYVKHSIQYINLASTGNTQYFGDLTVARGSGFGSAPSNTRCVFLGGEDAAGLTNTIDYITIQTAGNATDFGDLASATANSTAISDSHGGLGGY